MTGTQINTIRARFQTEVVDSLFPTVPVIYDNQLAEPPDSGTWMRVTILPGTSFQAALGGTKSFRHPFVMVVQLFNDIGTGTTRLQELADGIVPVFRGRTENSIAYKTPSVVSVGRFEKWFQWNVSCPGYAGDLIMEI